MFGDITVCKGSITWNSGVANPQILLPQNRRLMVLAVVLTGATGSTGEQVIIQGIQDSRTTVQRILGNVATGGTNGIPARILAHCGSFNPATGPRWAGARTDLMRRLKAEADLAGRDVGYLLDAFSALYRTTELPPVAGFIVNGDFLNFSLLSLASDQPDTISIIAIELAPSEDLDTDLNASPFWFASAVKEFGTAADPGLLWQDQIRTPGYLLARLQRFLHRATRLSRFNSSSGALVVTQPERISLSGAMPTGGGPYFYAGEVPIGTFAESGEAIFCVKYENGNLVQWNGSKLSTSVAVDAYLSHYFTVGV